MRNDVTSPNYEYTSLLGEQELFTSKGKTEFNLWDDKWYLDTAGASVDLSFLRKELPMEQEEALRRTFAVMSTDLSIASVQNHISALKAILKLSDDDDGLNIDVIVAFLSDSQSETYKSHITTLVRKVISLGYQDAFESGLGTFIESVSTKNNEKYNLENSEATRAFTDFEREQFIYQLARARYSGLISERAYLLYLLLLFTGKRPRQIRDTKVCDFSVEYIKVGDAGRKVIKWNAPVAKQRGRGFREVFNPTVLSVVLDFETLLQNVKEQSVIQVERYLGVTLDNSQRELVPLFCSLTHNNDYRESYIEASSIDEILRGPALHTFGVANTLRSTSNNTDIFLVQSERTGERLHIYPRRFRHTMATHAALQGSSIQELAYLLDHSNTRAARVYTDNLPKRAIQIGGQVEGILGVLAKKFDRDQEFVPDAEKVIRNYTKHKAEDVGNCGKESFCREDYPRACYLCDLFIPNPLGNHRSVLNDVERDLERQMQYGNEQMVENLRALQIGILERMFLANQVRLQMLREIPSLPLPIDSGKLIGEFCDEH